MRYQHFSGLQQLALAVLGLIVCILALDTGGLSAWATRLDLGPERDIAVPITAALAKVFHPLHTDRLRRRELSLLARTRWSDDAADVAAEEQPVDTTTPQPGDPTPTAENTGAGASTTVASTNSSAYADTTPDPLPPLKDPPLTKPPLDLPTLAPIQAVRVVALAGDSMMAVGLAPNLLNGAQPHKNVQLIKAFKSGTGLARPEVFNWQVEYPAMLGSAHPHVVIVAIGANDGQGFVVGKTTYPFGTDAWQQIYRTRVQAYLHMVEAGGSRVVWLGLPPMKSANYNTRIALINRIDYDVVSHDPQATWVSTAGFVGDESGSFREYGLVKERTVSLRQPDGIHLSDAGASLVTAELIPWLIATPSVPQAPQTQTPAANTTETSASSTPIQRKPSP